MSTAGVQPGVQPYTGFRGVQTPLGVQPPAAYNVQQMQMPFGAPQRPMTNYGAPPPYPGAQAGGWPGNSPYSNAGSRHPSPGPTPPVGGYGAPPMFAMHGGITSTPHPAQQSMPSSPRNTVQQHPAAMGTTFISSHGVSSANGAPRQHVSSPLGAPQTAREQVMADRIRELEQMMAQKDQTIKDLQATIAESGRASATGAGRNSRGVAGGARISPRTSAAKGIRSPRRSNSGKNLRAGLDTNLDVSSGLSKYAAGDREDPIDVRFEEVYNASNCSLFFRRINRGFYQFGAGTQVEMSIINHKLMARTEGEAWNRGKFGPVEKFLIYREGLERENNFASMAV